MKLTCPNCGFEFCVWLSGDIDDEELKQIKTCPCGTLMEESDETE